MMRDEGRSGEGISEERFIVESVYVVLGFFVLLENFFSFFMYVFMRFLLLGIDCVLG